MATHFARGILTEGHLNETRPNFTMKCKKVVINLSESNF